MGLRTAFRLGRGLLSRLVLLDALKSLSIETAKMEMAGDGNGKEGALPGPCRLCAHSDIAHRMP